MSTGVLSATFLPTFAPIGNHLWNKIESTDSQTSMDVHDGISRKSIVIGVITCALPVMLSIRGPSVKKSIPIDKKEEATSTITKTKNLTVAALSGSLFSVGLGMSGMIDRTKVYGFLNMNGFKTNTWDASLMFVMGGGLLVSFLGYQFVAGYNIVKVSKYYIYLQVYD